MATRSKGGPQSGGLSASSFGPGRASQPVAALVALQQQSQAQMQKLLKTIEQMEVRNAQAVQQAAQAGGGAATQVANQVAAGIDRQNQENTRKQERSEDKTHQQDMAKLNASLQSDLARETAAMGQSVLAHREKMIRFAKEFKSKKLGVQEAIAALDARNDEMLTAGYFSSEEGRKEYAQRVHLRDMMRVMGDDQSDPRHLEAAYDLHNKQIQASIARDGKEMDLARLQVDPLQLPMPKIPASGKRIARPEDLSPDKMFELKLLGGYPDGGVMFNGEENFGLPEGYSPRLMTPELALAVIARDDSLRFANDLSLRQEETRRNQQVVVKALDVLQPMKETYGVLNKAFNATAPQAVERALESFLGETNPHKFNDMGRTITALAIKEMFNGGPQGEKMAVIAMEIFDGKRELKTAEEGWIGMSLESAVFNIQRQMSTEFMNAGKEGQSLSTQLVNQMVDELGEEEAALALGVQNTEKGFVRAQEVMTARLAEGMAFGNRMHDGLWNASTLGEFRGDLRTMTRLSDVYAMQASGEGDQAQQRVIKLMGETEALEAVSEEVDSRSPDNIAAGRGKLDDTAQFESSVMMMNNLIELSKDMGPDVRREVAGFASANLDVLGPESIEAYLSQTKVEHERSGYAKNASERNTYYPRQQERARTAESEQKKSQEQGGELSTGEAFKQGGVPKVVTEKVPGLLSLGGRGIGQALIRGGTGLVQAAAGQDAATGFLKKFRTGENTIGAALAGVMADAPNLNRSERKQVVDEGLLPDDER